MRNIFFNMLFELGTLGLMNVITHLENNGFPSKHVYLTKVEEESESEMDSILSFVREEQPHLIGFSLMTFNFSRTKRITLEIKKQFPHVPIMWGGIHPTFEPEESIKYADYVCIGEGEDATLELIRALERKDGADQIPNIWSKRNGRVIKNDVRSLIQNLDSYPFPRINWERTYCLDEGKIVLLTHELYRKYVNYAGTIYDIMASRGCPYACSYCGNALFKKIYKGKGKYVRFRSVDNIIEQLKYVEEKFPYVNMISIQDDAFASAPETFLEGFARKYNSANIKLRLRVRIIPTMMSEKKAKFLAQANTLSAIMGVQSSERINKKVFDRHVSAKKLIEVTKFLTQYNIVGQYDLISRNPYETEEDMVEICDILSRIPKPYQLIMYPLAMFPHTPLREKAIKDGIPINKSDGYTSGYGDYPMRFPHLYAIQEVCQYTPKPLVDFFVSTRKTPFGKALFRAYYSLVYKGLQGLQEKIVKRPRLVIYVKALLFLPRILFRKVRVLK